jgi:RND family efflux transporter MFP subunit
LVALIAVALAGCGSDEVAEREPVVRPVKTMVVGGDQGERLSFPGTVQAAYRAELSFRVAGPLVELPVDEGDQVRRGQLMARIDPRDFEISLAEARAAYEKGEADYARYKNLYERNAVPLAELELRRAQRDVSAASYDQAQANLRDTRLVAPFNGRVGRKLVENFEDVVAKERILTLHDLGIVEIVIDAPEYVMATFRESSNPRFTAGFTSAPGIEFDLTLKETAAEADVQTQTFRVTFSMPQPEELRVLPGMTAEVNAYAEAPGDEAGAAAEFLIPAEALFASSGGDPQVWVVDTSDLTVHQREVRVGPVTGENSIRVLEGLERGETIAVAAVHQLQNGSKIRLMERRN